MFELNKHYGWSKFIVVVPSIAIREGVYKSFEVTQEHFAEEYGKKIRFFIYNSSQLTDIDRFASDNSINVMIINSQAFNAKGKDARRIYMKLDEFRSRRPIDIIAKTNPIMIIDDGYEDRWFIEIDLSTESPSTIIGKCDRYRDYYRSGLEQKQFGVFPVVVWLVLDAGRKERLRSAIQEAYPKGGKLFIVITADEFERLIRQGFDAKDLC